MLPLFLLLFYNKSMLVKSQAYLELSKIFNSHEYQLFLVGGTVRDILLNIPLDDMDVVTDATPDEMKAFIDGDYTFSKMGSVKYTFQDIKFDITTLRKEKRYSDYRHPTEVVFVRDLKTDHYRRDFTINAMYMNNHFELIDFENGEEDLNKRILRMVGNPLKRLKEDPLRILRAIRFSLTYDFTFDPDLENALISSIKFLDKISKDKIKMEFKKFKNIEKDKLDEMLEKYSIKHLKDVIE